ncbi:AIPR family protein [Hamadaea tsunoensis]|uniref:AIPR family protein n=1 Tax=Hamadaea tsunoensis TaxID=53368 RepID=UPI000427E815|nr:AIPR family protein [Hamadaea tsunoensis]
MPAPSNNETIRQVGTIANALLKDYANLIDTSDVLNQNDDEKRRALLTRCLAALVIKDRVGCDEKVAANSITDGGQDFGIDAVGIVPGVPRLWLVQTKWNDKAEGRLGEGDVMSVVDGLKRIDHQEYERFNSKLQRFAEQIKAIHNDRYCRITVVLAVMRKDPLHDNILKRLDEVKRDFNQHGDFLDFEIVTIREIWDMVRRTAAVAEISLSIGVDRWFDVSTPMRAVNAVVRAGDVAEWYQDHGNRLFDKNLRESLGVTQVNAEIARSLREEPADFWYRNNGIIMLCDQLQLHPNSRSAPHGPARVDVRAASIVNGAQTVAAIARAVSIDSIAAQGLVGIRIIESTDAEVGAQITKATNTQNHVERRDFVALDPAQIAIREDFSLSLDLTYSIRRTEFEPSPESGCTVREAAIALACANASVDLAWRARQSEELLWEEGPKGAYRQIFGVRPTAIQIWNSVLLLRSVRNALHQRHADLKGRARAVAEQANLIIAHIVFQQIGRDGIDNGEDDWKAVLDQVPAKVDEVLCWLMFELDLKYKGAFLATTLGNGDSLREIVRLVSRHFSAGDAVPDLADGYRPASPASKKRQRNAVPVLIDAGRIKDGTSLLFAATTGPEREAMRAWLAEDERRGLATWVNSRTQPLLWAMDGKRYSPSGLVMHMWELAEWNAAPVAAQGTSRWQIPGEGTLAGLAKIILRESGVSTDDESAV